MWRMMVWIGVAMLFTAVGYAAWVLLVAQPVAATLGQPGEGIWPILKVLIVSGTLSLLGFALLAAGMVGLRMKQDGR